METSAILGLMFRMESRIVIFEGNQKEGVFSRTKSVHKDGMTEEEIEEEVKKARIKLGKKFGFSGLKMFEAIQKKKDNNDLYPDNKYVVLKDKHMQKEDFFQEKIETDILIITSKYPKVAVSFGVADCAVIIAEDRKLGATALAHCGINEINRELPKGVIKSLIKEFNSNPKDIYLYIGSHIKKESYQYDKYPPQATNQEVWKDAIEEENGIYYIDLDQAIINQLKEFELGEIVISPIDTAKEPYYASHRMRMKGHLDKKGQNVVGFYYK